MKVYGRLRALLLALVLLAVATPTASAFVVHKHRGHFFGIAVHRGIKPGSARGAAGPAASSRASTTSTASSSTGIVYQGGPVVHSSAPYVIDWAPSGQSSYLPGSWQSTLQQYFTDTSADSGGSANVFGVLRQYTDGSGSTDYQQTFTAASQVISDTNPYPALDSGNCSSGWSRCVTDGQIETEVSNVIAAHHLPTDGHSTSHLPDGAPIYFVVLPSDVDVCFSDGSGECASNYFCAYHSNYADGSQQVLYAAIPTLDLTSASDEKSCQYDGNAAVQAPNRTAADVAISSISHEYSETVTDPLGTGWWDTNGAPATNAEYGYEVGDKCNDLSTDSNAFQPTLGGSAAAGTLYTQLINSHDYYTQSEWSNGNSACEMRPSSGTVSAQFTAPSGTDLANSTLSFDPSGSSSTNSLVGATWSWGDGSTSFSSGGSALARVSHTYATGGTYTVKLTVFDDHGNAASTSQTITVYPIAAFTYAPGSVVQGSPVTFDGSNSSEPGGSISRYAWDYGDGTTGSGVQPSHTYTAAGTYTVTLTVTDASSRTSTTSQRVTVVAAVPPTVSPITVTPAAATVGQSVSFSASATDSQASITDYSWNFGDGSAPLNGASETAPAHTYAASGTYTVTLTVSAGNGTTTTVTKTVTVGPLAAFTFGPGQPADGQMVSFDGSGSTDGEQNQSITGYAWNFGDGSIGSGRTATHSYVNPGSYTVTLTVTNGSESNTTSHVVTVSDTPPTAAFSLSTASPTPSQVVHFDGSTSSASDPNASLTYAWDFGDGSHGTGTTADHAFAGPGTYTVRLTVSDSYNSSTTVAENVNVQAVPVQVRDEPPTAVIAVQNLPAATGQAVAFSGAGSSDPDGSIVSYRWSFGDGATASGAAAGHTYARSGTYSVTLTVTDSAGQSTTAVRALTVAGRITKVKVSPSRTGTGATIAVTVSSAGTLTVGRRVFHLKRAATVKVVVALTRAQLHTVQVKHVLKVRVPLKFAPRIGPLATTSAVIAFRPTRTSG